MEKYKYDRLKDFDPRPEKYHNTATKNLAALLSKDYVFLYYLIQDHVYRMNQIGHQVVVVVAYLIYLTKVPFKKL